MYLKSQSWVRSHLTSLEAVAAFSLPRNSSVVARQTVTQARKQVYLIPDREIGNGAINRLQLRRVCGALYKMSPTVGNNPHRKLQTNT